MSIKKDFYLFDLDGTIIDSVNMHVKAFLEACDNLGIKKPENTEELFRKCVGMKFMEIVHNILKNYPETELIKLREERRKLLPKYIKEVKIIDPVYKKLLKLKQKGYPLALVTSSSRNFVELVNNNIFPIYKIFDVVVTSEDVSNGKPDPEPFLKAYYKLREKYGDPNNVYVVGDTDYDKIGAEKAGFKFIYYKDFALGEEI